MLTSDPVAAAEFIKRGGVVAFPTETVYGLGANVFDEAAIRKVFNAKQRPADNPLIAHIAEIGQLNDLAININPAANKLIANFFPGPLTLVLNKRAAVPVLATAGLDTIGVRMPAGDLAHDLIAASGVPLVAPSANLSGRPSPTTWQAVVEDLDGRIDCILQGAATEVGLESTVVDCTGEVPVLLRLGAVALSDLRSVVSETTTADDPHLQSRSPGLRHKHYSPRASVTVCDGRNNDEKAAFIGLKKPSAKFALVRVCSDVEEYARSLFEFFRECDRRGIGKICCEPVDEAGIGAALMDRIRRAGGR